MDSTPDPLLAIVGATASGKSELALQIAERAGGEIVSCDSVQLYRGFDIGSAKPGPSQRARTPHHLVDVIDWHEDFDAQRYVERADHAVETIRAAGKTPVLCGGTGLYLRAFRYGLVALPDPPVGLREKLTEEERENPGSLYARLLTEDPESARTIEPNNTVYVVRAFEIMAATGKKASDVRRAHGFKKPRIPMRLIALRWAPELLRERIERRIQAMVDAGLLDEVAQLIERGVDPACRPMRAVGYREASDVILKRAPRDGLEQRIAKSTWSYSRRQRTWLRKETGVEWIDIEDEKDLHLIATRFAP
ncbi:MAG: tRNA (adenosine(37)-N6)-dimethylallyltransferase MiaA [Myxococcota bacterium]